MPEYIERETVSCDYCTHYAICIFHINGDEYKKCVHFKNKADVVDVRHGEWIQLDECANEGVYCSVCHKKVYKIEYANQALNSAYCPNCGAKMDGKVEGE